MATQSVSYPICHKHVFSDYMKSGLWRSNPEQGPRIVERECNQIGVELLAAHAGNGGNRKRLKGRQRG